MLKVIGDKTLYQYEHHSMYLSKKGLLCVVLSHHVSERENAVAVRISYELSAMSFRLQSFAFNGLHFQ